MIKSRPLVLTVDFQQPDDAEYPTGKPVVTELRPMGWWEHIKYRLRNRNRRSPRSLSGMNIAGGLDIAIELSEAQYLKLVSGQSDTVHALKCLKGSAPELKLILPAAHDKQNSTVEMTSI